MNKALFLLFIVSFITGCNQNKQNTRDEFSKYVDARYEAELSEQIVDTIFLGLKFGMSEKEVNQHLNLLHQKGKLKLDAFGAYAYIMNTNEMKIKCSLGAEYFKGKLYYFRLRFNEWAPNSNSDHFLPISDRIRSTVINASRRLFLQSSELKKIKYDKYYYQLSDSINRSSFIKNNLIVEFSPYGEIEYINAPIRKQKEEFDKQSKKKNIKNTISDF